MEMLVESQESSLQSYPVRLRGHGQITIPQVIRDRLDVGDGDFLVLVEIGDLIFLTSKPLQTPRLADKLVDLMDETGITLADLLLGVNEERSAIEYVRTC